MADFDQVVYYLADFDQLVYFQSNESSHTDFRDRLTVKLKGRAEQLVVSRNHVELFRQR